MRLHLFAVIAAGLSLVQCSFDGGGLTGNTVSSLSNDTTGEAGSSGEMPTTGDPTAGAVCGNYNTDEGEECDNGMNNGGGGLCKDDCTLNVCGDGYLAPAVEGCDDGNDVDDDACTNDCKSKNCGNGTKDGLEQCDDGNDVDDDGCSNLCLLPICGDGIKNGDDECDSPMGNSDMGGCTSNCKTAVCGDGLLYEGVEACDDGNTVDDDECSNACATASCGDGMKQVGEDCDEGAGNSETGACLPSCKSASCGDGFVQEGVETCDDSNADGGDGCSAMCAPEVCGNGIMDPNDMCDDGNMDDTDDCRNDCTPAVCGDGVVAVNASMPEECDDNNKDDSDACPTTCKNAKCGDGFLFMGDPKEQCDDGGASATCDAMCKRSAYYVFATSMLYKGDAVDSLENADMLCNMAAEGKPIDGVYMAWLGDSNTTAATRLAHSTVRYIMPNAMMFKVADSWTDLTDGSLDLPINRDETGNLIGINPPPTNCGANNAADAAVWTGAMPNGDAAMNCNDWKDGNNMMGQAGLFNRNDMLWSNCQFKCDTMARLYCIEQPPP